MENEHVNEPPQDDTSSQPEQPGTPETPPEHTPPPPPDQQDTPPEQPPVTPEPKPEPAPEQSAAEFKVDIGEYLKSGWVLFTKDVPKYILAVLITIAISAVTIGILAGPMFVGLYICLLKKARGGDFEYGELFDGLKKQFLASFLLGIVYFAIMCVVSFVPVLGSLLSLAASFVISPFFIYSLYEMAESPETIEAGQLVDLVKSVYARIKSQLVMVMLWLFIANLIASVGFAVCCIGVLVTYPFAFLAVTVSYMGIFKNEQAVIPQA